MLISCLLLAALGVAVFPCWRYSATWGHGPSIAVGGLLIFMAALAVSGKGWQRAGAAVAPAPAELSVALPARHRESSPPR
ncbi:MAG: DUF3309 family protein [Reyranella sp.]|uniref:DUF3309 family protein n=1 Tax=Reyranella sp. TaxID=1929291 RepID=UPI003D12790B